MKVAVIDIGTNTFNLLIASMSGSKLIFEHVEKKFVFLGKGGINRNTIQEDAFERGIKTLQSFSKKAKKHQVQETIAIATSAVRSANNGNKFVNEALNKAGIEINIITGSTEAEYIYKGAKLATQFGTKPILLMDIGGGSTEFIICNENQIFWKQSFEIGVIRLFEKFHQNDPVSKEEISNIEQYLTNQLNALFKAIKQYKINTLIGSAGAFTSLAKIIVSYNNSGEKMKKTSEYEFDINQFNEIHNNILHSTLEERLETPGLVKKRAPTIVVGTILVNFIIHQFKIENFKLARYALKEGVASDYFLNL
jgi:exopolyphosphatase/guanosine-5'-triphosphate,3'-diphosphate pyrophosphatase